MRAEQPFARFVRRGGTGAVVVDLRDRRFDADGRLSATETKSTAPIEAAIARFRNRLHALDAQNRAFLHAHLDGLIGGGDTLRVSDMSEEIDEAARAFRDRLMAHRAWRAWNAEVGTAAWAVREDALAHLMAHRFSARINQYRQKQLGITHYIWRSRDDAKVREDHAARDDQVYAWDHVHADGHPGHAANCRCIAEPLWNAADEFYEPKTGLALDLVILDAEAEGIGDAAGEIVSELLEDITELPQALALAARTAYRLVELSSKERAGTIAEAERAELDGLRAALRDRAADAVDALRDAPEAARAFADYVAAVHARVLAVDGACRASHATEAELREAYRDRAYLDTLVLSTILPAGLFAKLLARLSRVPDFGGDAAALTDWLRRATQGLRRDPTDRGWRVIRNPGIARGGGNAPQGEAWEKYLEASGDLGERLHDQFEMFDFFDRQRRVATRAKTLNVGAPSYRKKPTSVYAKLKKYADDDADFVEHEVGKDSVKADMIDSRRLELAIPAVASTEQNMHIQRAIDYAAERGVDLIVMRLE